MPVAAMVFAGIAAAIHVFFFYLESIAWRKPSTWETFGIASQEDAETTHGLALNQGYYNLFLAIGVIVGIVLGATSDGDWTLYAPLSDDPGSTADLALGNLQEHIWGEALVVFGTACMLAAAVVLLVSSRGKMLRGVVIQGLAPLLALLLIALT